MHSKNIRNGRTLLTLAVVVALATSAGTLAFIDARLMQQMLSHRETSVEPVGGILMGVNARDDSAWSIGDSEHEAADRITVFFPTSSSVNSMGYWRKVALALDEVSPNADVEFVGVCIQSEGGCVSPRESEAYAVLSFMDPIQMHAMAHAHKSSLAYMYRGHSIIASLESNDDPSVMASNIAESLFEQTTLSAGYVISPDSP